jgi:uncharacterized membrane protein YozB (DUF420 family)
MAAIDTPLVGGAERDPFALVIDRWIYVFMAVFFIAVTLTGFIPDSLEKIAAVEAGERAPFPLVLHLHSILMGSFLALLLTQTILAATGRLDHHRKLGMISAVLVPALVVVGFILVPTMHQLRWEAMQAAPPEVQAEMAESFRISNNIMLAQIRIGIAFPLFVLLAFLARKTDSGLHKRLMVLAVVPALPAGFDRITWIPHTLPESPLSMDLYMLLAVAPLLIWDLARTGKVHKAFLIWFGVMVPSSLLIHALWGGDWWQATAPRLVGL